MNIFEDIRQSFRQGNSLHRLIYINVGLFLAVQIVRIVYFLLNAADQFPGFISWLAIPSNLQTLASRPWTLITYMFLHVDFIHILFNMLWLYWFGRIFVEDLGLKKLVSIYILGGLAGGVLYVAFYNLFPVFEPVVSESIALGASASVMAIVIAAAFYRPERRLHLIFIGPVQIIIVAIVMFILTSLVDFTTNTGGKIAHIGGALTGFIFTYYYRRGKDITRGFDRLMDRIALFFKPGRPKKMKVTHRRPADDHQYNSQKAEEQKEIDAILDKISKGGYDSLTAQEKERLFKMGNRN
ncbi:MAG: rhomboid family intramembrane serine protease [Bacteroidales bacterium]|nr:rhomboid family intramembrane serine protease [Bacteroidales bacterium]